MDRPALADGDQPVVIAREEWLGQDENPALWAQAMICCENPMAGCGRAGRCEYDGDCFRLPRDTHIRRGATSAQAMFHHYVAVLEDAYRTIRAAQRADVARDLPGLIESLERTRAGIECVLGRKPE